MKSKKRHLQHCIDAFVIVVSPILFIIFPALFLFIYKELTLVEGLLSFFYFLFVTIAIGSASLLSKQYFIHAAISGAATFYYMCVYTLIIHILYVGHRFDAFFFLHSYSDVWHTGMAIFGLHIFWMIVLSVLFCVFVYKIVTYYCRAIDKYSALLSRGIAKGIAIASLSSAMLLSSYGYIIPVIQSTWRSMEVRNVVPPNYVPFDIEGVEPKKDENVIVLQLESINALAAQGYIQEYSESYIPTLLEIAREGTYFPLFWSNSVQTNRAQMNILCGTVGNSDAAFSYRLSEIHIRCLPHLLVQLGYKTFAYRSDTLAFANTGKFFETLGFQHVIGPEIMGPEDQKYEWGYDDCQFYDRSISNLYNKAQGENFFGFIEVSSHHFPFKDDRNHPDGAFFKDPQNFQEHYLNSLQYQDYCLQQFIKTVQRYDEGNTHIFISADTSWPLGMHGNYFIEHNAYNENFMTVLAYIPPEKNKNNYNTDARSEKILAASDITPTVLELLLDQSYSNSFAPILSDDTQKITDSYEDCHVLTQPYAEPKVAIVQNTNKYIYSVLDRTVTYFDLGNDLYEQHPRVLASGVAPEEFFDEYYCKRFTHVIGSTLEPFVFYISGRHILPLGLLLVLTLLVIVGYLESGVRAPTCRTQKIPVRMVQIFQSSVSMHILQLALPVFIIGICLYALMMPTSTILADFVWRDLIVIWLLLSLLVGNLWSLLHPSAALVRFFVKKSQTPKVTIEKYGIWPACLLLFCYVWIGTIFAHSHHSLPLVVVITLYFFLTSIGMYVCGIKYWLQHADPFAVGSLLLSLGALMQSDKKKMYSLQPPVVGLFAPQKYNKDVVAFISLAIASFFFAAIHDTEMWLVRVHEWMAIGAPYKLVQTASLLLLWGALYQAWMYTSRSLAQIVVSPLLFILIGLIVTHFVAHHPIIQMSVVLIVHVLAQFAVFLHGATHTSSLTRALPLTVLIVCISFMSICFIVP